MVACCACLLVCLLAAGMVCSCVCVCALNRGRSWHQRWKPRSENDSCCTSLSLCCAPFGDSSTASMWYYLHSSTTTHCIALLSTYASTAGVCVPHKHLQLFTPKHNLPMFLVALESFFSPLQGFLNSLVYGMNEQVRRRVVHPLAPFPPAQHHSEAVLCCVCLLLQLRHRYATLVCKCRRQRPASFSHEYMTHTTRALTSKQQGAH